MLFDKRYAKLAKRISCSERNQVFLCAILKYINENNEKDSKTFEAALEIVGKSKFGEIEHMFSFLKPGSSERRIASIMRNLYSEEEIKSIMKSAFIDLFIFTSLTDSPEKISECI